MENGCLRNRHRGQGPDSLRGVGPLVVMVAQKMGRNGVGSRFFCARLAPSCPGCLRAATGQRYEAVSEEKAGGATYTPQLLADFVARQIVEMAGDLSDKRVLRHWFSKIFAITV